MAVVPRVPRHRRWSTSRSSRRPRHPVPGAPGAGHDNAPGIGPPPVGGRVAAQREKAQGLLPGKSTGPRPGSARRGCPLPGGAALLLRGVLLVHGKTERNEMVQYCAEHLDSFATTVHGPVRSYGSRCTHPSVLWGDVSREGPGVRGQQAERIGPPLLVQPGAGPVPAHTG